MCSFQMFKPADKNKGKYGQFSGLNPRVPAHHPAPQLRQSEEIARRAYGCPQSSACSWVLQSWGLESPAPKESLPTLGALCQRVRLIKSMGELSCSLGQQRQQLDPQQYGTSDL